MHLTARLSETRRAALVQLVRRKVQPLGAGRSAVQHCADYCLQLCATGCRPIEALRQTVSHFARVVDESCHT